MKRVFVCLVVALMVALGPVGTGYALSDAEYRELLKDPDFRFEDALLGKVWKRVYGSLSAADKKILLADQRDWLKNRRDACAADYMRQGMDKVHAYCWAVNVRTHALQMIEDDSLELVGAGQLIEGVTEKRLPLDEAELFQCLAPEAEGEGHPQGGLAGGGGPRHRHHRGAAVRLIRSVQTVFPAPFGSA